MCQGNQQGADPDAGERLAQPGRGSHEPQFQGKSAAETMGGTASAGWNQAKPKPARREERKVPGGRGGRCGDAASGGAGFETGVDNQDGGDGMERELRPEEQTQEDRRPVAQRAAKGAVEPIATALAA